MGGRDMRRIHRASAYPCPFCSADDGFRPGPDGLFGWAKSATSALAAVISHPAVFMGAMANGGLVARCNRCGEQVDICGACDHPNRSVGILRTCIHCGNEYVA